MSLKHKINVWEVFFFPKTHVMETKFLKKNKQNISLSKSSNHNLIPIQFFWAVVSDTERLRLKVMSVVLQFKASFFSAICSFNHIFPVCILGSRCTQIVAQRGGFLASSTSPRISFGCQTERSWVVRGSDQELRKKIPSTHVSSLSLKCSKPDDLTHSQTQSDD